MAAGGRKLCLTVCVLCMTVTCSFALFLEEPVHDEMELGGLRAFVSQPANASHVAVVLLSDVYGWSSPEIRQWAGALAKEGIIAIVPDFFRNDPLKYNATFQEFVAWSARHPRSQTERDLPVVFGAIRKLYPTVTKIGVEGYCWGGLYALVACGGTKPLADACVSYHISPVLPPDAIRGIAKPTLFVLADPALDIFLNQTALDAVTPLIQQKNASGIATRISVYTGQPHGFALGFKHTGGSPKAPTPAVYAAAAAAAHKAYGEGLAWLAKHLNFN